MKKLKKLLDGPACKGSSTVAFVTRGDVDRKQLGPFVRGYLDEMLKRQFPFHDIGDISERWIQQCIRDCIHFYYANHQRLEKLWNDPFDDYTEGDTGRDFWLSRNLLRGFEAHTSVFGEDGDMTWLCLEASAIGFGSRVNGVYENPRGEIDMNYEET